MLNGTRIGYGTRWGGSGGGGAVRGGLKQAKGPRHYSKSLVAASSSTCRPAPSVLGGPPGGKVGVRLQSQPDPQGESS